MADGGQLFLDLDYDERTEELAREVAFALSPRMAPGTTVESVRALADRLARMAYEKYKNFQEPECEIRCHTCDEMTTRRNRVRVAVCARCALVGRSPGSGG